MQTAAWDTCTWMYMSPSLTPCWYPFDVQPSVAYELTALATFDKIEPLAPVQGELCQTNVVAEPRGPVGVSTF